MNGIKITGNIESTFLYSTLTSSEVVPFGYLSPLTVVLPLVIGEDGRYLLLNSGNARARQFNELAKWLKVTGWLNRKRLWASDHSKEIEN